MPKIHLSVIIPSHNREKYLDLLSTTINPQLKEGDELILVDDASKDGTLAKARELGFTVIHLEENGGVGKARNEGARAAKNEVLVFFDDDIIPAENYLDVVRKLFSDESMLCCQGLHELTPANKEPNIWHRTEALIWHHCMGTLSAQENGCHSVFSQSFNIRKSTFFEVGGFSENFQGAGGEEFELAGRLFKATTIHLKPELKTRHEFQSLFPRLRTLYRRAQNFRKIYNDMEDDWKQSHFSEVMRSGFSFLFVLVLVVGFYDFRIWWGLMVVVVLFALVDVAFVLNLIKWKKIVWIPVCLFQRLVQYIAISAGLLRGMV